MLQVTQPCESWGGEGGGTTSPTSGNQWDAVKMLLLQMNWKTVHSPPAQGDRGR